MSDTVLTPRFSPTPVLFAAAIFTSAALVFAVQPMITKMILPQLGGSPAVWNTAMVFFQAALLAGYAYAHGLQRIASLKVQAGVHLGLLALSAIFLPLQVSGALGEPPPGAPILWLLGVLTISIGAPFAVLSATAPLLQAWFARVHAGEERAENPYVLYAASNLGSFVALLAYPVVIEPTLRVAQQTAVWTGGYAFFFAMVLTLGWLAWRNRREGETDHAPLSVTAAPSWKTRIAWLLLAAAPSSLMLGVTTHLSTDVASAPFLWVAPLSLYLLTFVVAFQSKPFINRDWGLILHAAAVSALVALLPFNTNEWAVLFVMNLAAFFFTALMCHQSLAALRPAPDRLTEFYLWLSLGGVVGGAATALVAPVVFDVVREYPLVLVLAALARPWGERRKIEWTDWFWLVAVGLLCLVTVAIIALSINSGRFREFIPFSTAELLAHGLLAGASLAAFMIRDRILMFVVALAAITVSAHSVAGRYEWTHSERSFFGVMRIATFDDPRLGEVKMLLHGTTLHGAQISREVNQCVPMLYYAVRTPIGQAMLRTQARHREARLGVVGLGTGALGAYVRPTDRMTYYEIDPAVERLARNPEHFTYLSKCAEGPVNVVLGDARLSLAKTPSDTYDLLVVDAFTSDSVPTHLLTVEAVREYLRVIKPDGAVILHLSNRNLEITTPAAATAKAAGGVALHQIYIQGEETSDLEEASTEALLITRSEAAARIWANDSRWTDPPVSEAGPWTDDYTNLVGALVRDIRSR